MWYVLDKGPPPYWELSVHSGSSHAGHRDPRFMGTRSILSCVIDPPVWPRHWRYWILQIFDSNVSMETEILRERRRLSLRNNMFSFFGIFIFVIIEISTSVFFCVMNVGFEVWNQGIKCEKYWEYRSCWVGSDGWL